MKDVTPEIAHQVLWEYGCADDSEKRIGYPGGNFTRALIVAIMRADPSNRRLIHFGFPGYVQACNVIERQINGAELLRRVATREAADNNAELAARTFVDEQLADIADQACACPEQVTAENQCQPCRALHLYTLRALERRQQVKP